MTPLIPTRNQPLSRSVLTRSSRKSRSRKYRKKTSSDDGGQSTASDKSSDDLFSLMTAWNTSSDLKKQGIDIDKVISERMAAAHISREFTPVRRCLWRLRCRAIFASQGSFGDIDLSHTVPSVDRTPSRTMIAHRFPSRLLFSNLMRATQIPTQNQSNTASVIAQRYSCIDV
jgi:hypothetical protein